MNAWSRIRQRKIVQWSLAYLAGAWVVLQLIDVLTDRVGWSDVVFQGALVVLAVGLLAAVVLAWYHGERGAQRVSATELGMLTGILVIAGVGVTLVVGPSGSDSDDLTPPGGMVEDGRPSLAVLPFENMSGSDDDRYFSDGLHEELLTRLARIRGLELRSRTSVQGYRDSQKNVRDIATELGVGHLVEASVRRAGDQLRITVQLIDARTDAHLWAETYDREYAAEAIFGIQSDVAEQIALALGTALSPEEATLLASRPTESVEAYDLYLRGMDSHRRSNGEPDIRAALSMFERAVAIDPRFAQAWARAAQQRFRLRWFAFDATAEALEDAEDALARAQSLAPENLEVLTAEGYYYYYGRRDYENAVRTFGRALQLDPDNAELLASIGYVYRRQGRVEEAATQLERAVALDPRAVGYAREYSLTLLGLGRVVNAWELSDRALALAPSDPLIYRDRSRLAQAQGDLGRARAELQAAADAGLDTPEVQYQGIFVALAGGDAPEALTRIRAAPGLLDVQDLYRPLALLEGFAHTLRGDEPAARATFESARRDLEEQTRADPDDWRYWSSLGLANAGLGLVSEAIRSSDRALEILPREADRWGIWRLEDRALMYTMVGDHERAITELDLLLSGNGSGRLTPARLRQESWWEPLRNRPDFQALLARHDR